MTVQSYEKVLLTRGRLDELFLYVLHFNEANCLHFGVGWGTRSDLNRQHVPGVKLHRTEVQEFADYIRREKSLAVDTGALASRFFQTGAFELTDGGMLVLDSFGPENLLPRFADAVERVGIRAFGHPLDWEVENVELHDGRFLWMAYDRTLDKIRYGIGFHNDAGEKQYGAPCYAIGGAEAGEFVAYHYTAPDDAMVFYAQPPRWPEMMSPFVNGKDKVRFAREFLRLADKCWPGQVG